MERRFFTLETGDGFSEGVADSGLKGDAIQVSGSLGRGHSALCPHFRSSSIMQARSNGGQVCGAGTRNWRE